MKHPRFIQKIKPGNGGSALVTVVVAMTFVMVLGAALLFAAYTTYSVKIAERGAASSFYDASSAMDDIRAGLQTAVSDAIESAYTTTIVEYNNNTDPSYDPQAKFNERFIAALVAKEVSDGTDTEYLFSNAGGTITGYNVAALEMLIDSANRASTVVSGSGVTAVASGSTLAALVLNTVSIQFVSPKGYESDVSSDIRIMMPDFFAGTSMTSGINNYAIIARQLSAGVGSFTINGSVFAGASVAEAGTGIDVSAGAGSSLSFVDGDVFCKGLVSVSNSSTLNFTAPTREFWANDILLGTGGTGSANTQGTISLAGKVYVADDLALNGKDSSATLKNTYFGFGSSATNPESSSSILINGRNCTLNISDLTKLSLAGISFIDIAADREAQALAGAGTAPLMMGESMSVKSDQLAYLVPVSCITNPEYASNPCFFPSTVVPTPVIDGSAVLWTIGGQEKKLSDYISVGNIKTIYKPMGDDQTIAYVFMNFPNRASANAYFRDYFTDDPQKITQYLNLYLSNFSSISDVSGISTAGNAYYTDGKGTAVATDDTLALQSPVSGLYSSGLQTRYDGQGSPFYAYISAAKLSGLPSGVTLEFRNADNEIVAIINTSTHNFSYDSTVGSTVRLIVSKGDVEINSNYTGMILTEQTLIANANITAVALSVEMLGASCTVSGTTYYLSDLLTGANTLSGTSSTETDPWNLNVLVAYENWAKN